MTAPTHLRVAGLGLGSVGVSVSVSVSAAISVPGCAIARALPGATYARADGRAS